MIRDNGLQPILWIAARCLSEKDLARWPTLRPIWIAPSLVGATAPLVVSPHHGMVLRMHPGDEYLVRAVHLARTPGGQARQMRGCKGITYIHLMFEYHQIIFANGAPSESFYPEPQAMSALDADARAELAALFPGLTLDNVPQSYGLSARQFAHLQDLPDHLRGFLAG